MPDPAPKALRQVVHTVPLIALESSGYAYSTLSLTQALADQGIDARLASIDAAGHRSVPAHVHLFPRSPGPAKLGLCRSMRRWMNEAAGRGDIGLMHSHSMWAMPGIYADAVSAKFQIPHVLSPRGTLAAAAMQSGSLAKRPFWHLLQERALRRATAFHATSEGEVADIRRLGFKQPIALLPNGIHIPAFVRRRTEMRQVLFLGRLHPIKQPEVLLHAWSRVAAHHDDWELVVAGLDYDSPGYLESMRRLATTLRLPRVRFVGELTGEAKLDAYRSADLYVLPTKSENFGITVAEALAAGTAVIVTHGAPWSGLTEHDAGWWIEQGVTPLAIAMEDAMGRSRRELERMGARGRDWVARDFDWSRIAADMAVYYRWICSGVRADDQPAFVRTAQ